MIVCLLAGLCKNYSTDFHKIWWKGGTCVDGNWDHVVLGLGLVGHHHTLMGGYVA